MIPPAKPTPIYFLRRGTLYGAALGLLLGLANIAFEGYSHREAIRYWRGWIGGGAIVGLAAGAIRAGELWRARREEETRLPPDSSAD